MTFFSLLGNTYETNNDVFTFLVRAISNRGMNLNLLMTFLTSESSQNYRAMLSNPIYWWANDFAFFTCISFYLDTCFFP